MSDLLRKDKVFQFGEIERRAFAELKRMLTQDSVLLIYNPNYETELHTDACKDGYGAALMQKSPDDGRYHPVYYISRKSKPEERNYSSYELEALAIVRALEKFHVYLLGIDFTIITDCAAFQQTMSKQNLVPRIARWAFLLEDFKYKIEHRPGTRMKYVDALSRNPVILINKNVIPKIQKLQKNDSEIRAILEILKSGPYENYCTYENILYKYVDGRELLLVPRALQTEIIHGTHQRGHFGIKRTEEIIKQEYLILDLKQKIERCIFSGCIPCIIANNKSGKQEEFLHPLIKSDVPLYTCGSSRAIRHK